MIRILIVSASKIPYSLRNLLEKSQDVEVIREHRADVILFYCESWDRTGLMQLEQTREANPFPAIVVCEKAREPFRTDSVVTGKVSAVFHISTTEHQLISGLRTIMTGLRVLQDFPRENHSRAAPIALTPRELEVLQLIADGEGNKSIADLLEISEHTVKFHISSIFEKLQVSSRTEAIRAGIRSGLISI